MVMTSSWVRPLWVAGWCCLARSLAAYDSAKLSVVAVLRSCRGKKKKKKKEGTKDKKRKTMFELVL